MPSPSEQTAMNHSGATVATRVAELRGLACQHVSRVFTGSTFKQQWADWTDHFVMKPWARNKGLAYGVRCTAYGARISGTTGSRTSLNLKAPGYTFGPWGGNHRFSLAGSPHPTLIRLIPIEPAPLLSSSCPNYFFLSSSNLDLVWISGPSPTSQTENNS